VRRAAFLVMLMLAACLIAAAPASARRFCPPVVEIEEGAFVKIDAEPPA